MRNENKENFKLISGKIFKKAFLRSAEKKKVWIFKESSNWFQERSVNLAENLFRELRSITIHSGNYCYIRVNGIKSHIHQIQTVLSHLQPHQLRCSSSRSKFVNWSYLIKLRMERAAIDQKAFYSYFTGRARIDLFTSHSLSCTWHN